MVYASKSPSVEETRYSLLRTPDTFPPADLPVQTEPPGLDAKRQWYLYDKIREFCSEGGADITCPRPIIPKPNNRVAENVDAPLQKIPRRD